MTWADWVSVFCKTDNTTSLSLLPAQCDRSWLFLLRPQRMSGRSRHGTDLTAVIALPSSALNYFWMIEGKPHNPLMHAQGVV